MASDAKNAGWTPEPWARCGPYAEGAFLDSGFLITTGYDVHQPEPEVGMFDGRDPLHGRSVGFTDADSARLISCVNACAGLADPAVEIAALRAEVERLRGALEKIADAPANGPGGELYYEFVDPETGQTGAMHVDPIGWIGDAANKARSALAGK